VEVSEGARGDEVERRGVVSIGFAGKACDDVGAYGGVGQALMDQFDAAGVMFGAIPAMHGGENAVGSGLQRHVEVRRDAVSGGEKVDQVLGDVERLDGADAQALDGSFAEDAAQQVKKFDARHEVAAVGAEVDTAENDFTESGFRETLDFREYRLRRQATGLAADERNYTE